MKPRDLPRVMGIAPVPATDKVLAEAGLTMEDTDLIEINETFPMGLFNEHPRARYGLPTMCVGRGQGSSVIR